MADRRHRFTTRARTTVKTLPAWAFSVTVLPPRVPLGVVRWPFGEGSIENPMVYLDLCLTSLWLVINHQIDRLVEN